MIKYEMLKCVDEIKMFKNIDEFYKMHYDCNIDDTFNTIDDLLNLTMKMQLICESYERFKIELNKNNIDFYIVICDFENEYIYIYDKKTNNIYFAKNDFIFKNNFTLCKIENINEKLNLMYLFFNVMLINE